MVLRVIPFHFLFLILHKCHCITKKPTEILAHSTLQLEVSNPSKTYELSFERIVQKDSKLFLQTIKSFLVIIENGFDSLLPNQDKVMVAKVNN